MILVRFTQEGSGAITCGGVAGGGFVVTINLTRTDDLRSDKRIDEVSGGPGIEASGAPHRQLI